MPVRVLDAAGVGSTDDVGAGILWAARNGADVINVSLQFDAAVDRLRRRCRRVCDGDPQGESARRAGRRRGRQRDSSGKGERAGPVPRRGARRARGRRDDRARLPRRLLALTASAPTWSRRAAAAAAAARAPGLRRRSATRPPAQLRLLPGLPASATTTASRSAPTSGPRCRPPTRAGSRRWCSPAASPASTRADQASRRAPPVHRAAGAAGALLRPGTARRPARGRSRRAAATAD